MRLVGCSMMHGSRVVLNAFAPLLLASYDYDLLHTSCGQAMLGYTIPNSGARPVFSRFDFKPVLFRRKSCLGSCLQARKLFRLVVALSTAWHPRRPLRRAQRVLRARARRRGRLRRNRVRRLLHKVPRARTRRRPRLRARARRGRLRRIRVRRRLVHRVPRARTRRHPWR